MLVLLVDDDEDCRRIFRIAMESAGHVVLLARDGVEGLRMARAAGPDLVLMDIAMPGLDGLAALRRLRASRETRDLHVVAMTAGAAGYGMSEYLAAGFDGYLMKPVAPSALLVALRRMEGGQWRR